MFAREMERKELDWTFIAFSDECSFWRVNMRANKLQTTNSLKEEGTGSKDVKISCWDRITAREALTIATFKDNMNNTKLVNIVRRRLGEFTGGIYRYIFGRFLW